MTNRDDTLIVVTSDHAHTMSMSGYPDRGNPIAGLNNYLSDVGMVIHFSRKFSTLFNSMHSLFGFAFRLRKIIYQRLRYRMQMGQGMVCS